MRKEERRGGGMLDDGLDRRMFERFPANLQARLFYGNMIYSGMVKNLSRNGMFVSTKVKFRVDSELTLIVLLNEQTVKIPVKVRRQVGKESDCCSKADNGIGVELLRVPQNYLNYVGRRNSSMRFSY